MNPTRAGSLQLFRFKGIDVFVHWTWFLAAAYFMQVRNQRYDSPGFAIADYLILFGIVIMHEFGHALACRQVGGFAHDIVLSPLGGVAYVEPPHRPGAYLWSIAAGPLVNVALVPILWGLKTWALASLTSPEPSKFVTLDIYRLAYMVYLTNWFLLIFNILPIYPMDGGKILHSLLWYRIGYRRALLAATTVGLVGCACLAAVAIYFEQPFLLFFAVIFFIECRSAWLGAKSGSY